MQMGCWLPHQGLTPLATLCRPSGAEARRLNFYLTETNCRPFRLRAEAFTPRDCGMGNKGSAGRSRNKEARANSLPDGLSAAELDARRAERLGTVETLKAGRTPLTVIEVAERATAVAESAIQAFMGTHP